MTEVQLVSSSTTTLGDGRGLYAERAGDGVPIVVFEAGMGASRNSWGAVVPLVAAETTTVAYDRSGLGRSGPDDQPRVLGRLADDLVGLLDQLGAGPFVLVGHSWGGPIVRSAAARLPDRIAGLVLVDQTDERCDLFFSKANERQARWMSPLMPALAKLGVIRFGVKRLARSLPEPAATRLVAEDGTVAAVRTQQAELRLYVDDLRRLRDDPLELPDVPVSVISGAKAGFLERGRRGELVAAHEATAASFPRGRHVSAADSSHYVPITDAQLVADEILSIVRAARAQLEK
ncbi:MAG: alpha/beta hydrolase [Ilumatobacteraceae bacterium]